MNGWAAMPDWCFHLSAKILTTYRNAIHFNTPEAYFFTGLLQWAREICEMFNDEYVSK